MRRWICGCNFLIPADVTNSTMAFTYRLKHTNRNSGALQ